MNDRYDESADMSAEDEVFAARLAQRLQQETEELDAATLSRLNKARHAALAEIESRRGFNLRAINWAPASAVVMVALIAGSLWLAEPGLNDPELLTQPVAYSTQRPLAAEDFELLFAAEDLELFDELDFYSWLETEWEPEIPPETIEPPNQSLLLRWTEDQLIG